MDIGKIPENVLKRSVFEQIHHRRPEVLLCPGVGEDCSAVATEKDEVLVLSVDPITATTKGEGTLAIHVTANDLASAGAEPVAFLLNILLPPRTREIRLREMMQEMERACRDLAAEIIGGHTEVTDAVNRPVISVTGIGKVKKDALFSTSGLTPGDSLVMTKWAGLEGTAVIAQEKEEVLLQTLPRELIDQAKSFSQMISVVPEAKIAAKNGAVCLHDITEGGIFGALWEVGEASHVGLTVNVKQIPVRQETVEICEVFSLNLYRMMSSGSLLIGCKDGELMVEKLAKAGIFSAVIGRVNDSNDRVVVNTRGETRFLEPAGSDELYKIYQSV